MMVPLSLTYSIGKVDGLTAGRLAAPLRGRHSGPEAGRLDRLCGFHARGYTGRADGCFWLGAFVFTYAAASNNMRFSSR